MRSLKMILPLALLSLTPLVLGACGGGDEAATGARQTNRQEVMAELDRELEQIDRKLEQVGQRIENSAGEADAELEQTYAELKDKREDIGTSMDELRNASEDRWDAVHRDLKKSLDEFSGGVEQAWKDLGI